MSEVLEGVPLLVLANKQDVEVSQVPVECNGLLSIFWKEEGTCAVIFIVSVLSLSLEASAYSGLPETVKYLTVSYWPRGRQWPQTRRWVSRVLSAHPFFSTEAQVERKVCSLLIFAFKFPGKFITLNVLISLNLEVCLLQTVITSAGAVLFSVCFSLVSPSVNLFENKYSETTSRWGIRIESTILTVSTQK